MFRCGNRNKTNRRGRDRFLLLHHKAIILMETASAPVVTKNVSGRRELHFHAIDEIVADAEKLVASPNIKTLGNWPLGRLLAHLTTAINGSIDGVDARAPLLFRLAGKLVKNRILNSAMLPGFQLPDRFQADLFPEVESPQDALEGLLKAAARAKTERMTACHPVFGQLTHDEWTQLHLRHAELHLSFVVPE